MTIDFAPTEEQEALCDAIRSFAEKHLAHPPPRSFEDASFRERWNRCAELGVQGLAVPERFGGQGADAVTVVLALEALGQSCRDNGLLFSLNAHMWSASAPLVRFGTEEQQARWLPGLCDGSLIGVQCMTEPDSGSDAFSLAGRAVPDGDSYVLNGQKTFITNAPVADVFVAFLATDADRGWAGLTAFIVEPDLPGVTVGQPFEKMGLTSSPMSEVLFDDCRVPSDNVLGTPGNGAMVFNHSIDWERSCILATAVGTMQRQVDETVDYARRRRQFGTHIGDFQAISHRVVDMKVRVDAARMLLYHMAWQKSRGKPARLEGSIVKLFTSEAWVQSSLDQIQIHGGYGYMVDSGIEANLRDAVASRIYSGTSEIQKNMIAHALGLSRPER